MAFPTREEGQRAVALCPSSFVDCAYLGRLGNLAKKCQTPNRNPLGDEDVVFVDPNRAVRVNKLADRHLLARHIAKFFGRAVSQVDNRLVLLVQDRDHVFKIRYEHLAFAIEVDVTRHAETISQKGDVLASQGQILDASVASVGNDQLGLAVTAVDPKAMRARDLSLFLSGAADELHVVAILGVLVDVATAVSVADEEVAVRGEGYVGRNECMMVVIDAGFGGHAL